jgi:hypothetical protein
MITRILLLASVSVGAQEAAAQTKIPEQAHGQFAFLNFLNSRLVPCPTKMESWCGGINDINCAKISRDIIREAERHRGSVAFRKALIAELKSERSDAGAYVLLNELYPDEKLELPTGPFSFSQGSRQLLFRSDEYVISIGVKRTTYQQICVDYWNIQLLSHRSNSDRLSNHKYRLNDPPVSLEERMKEILQKLELDAEEGNKMKIKKSGE